MAIQQERVLDQSDQSTSLGPTMPVCRSIAPTDARNGGRTTADKRPVAESADLLPQFDRASDAELAAALRRHQTAALDEAFRRHADHVALTVRRIANAYYIDDVVQDVFLSLWRAPERFQPQRGSLADYLAIVTRGRTLDRLRSDGAWHRRQVQHDVRQTRGDEVEDGVIAGVTAIEVQIALRALPMSERVAIELAFFGGDSYRQVAVKLGEPEGTIKGRIRRGLRRLEVSLRGIEEQEIA